MLFTPGRFISPKESLNITSIYFNSNTVKAVQVQYKSQNTDINNDNNNVSFMYKKVYR